MKEMLFKCNDCCYAKEITIRRLPKSELEKESLARMLYRAESTENFDELIDEMMATSEDYSSIIISMIGTGLLTEELYNKIYCYYKNDSKVKICLMYTLGTKNPIPSWMEKEIRLSK